MNHLEHLSFLEFIRKSFQNVEERYHRKAGRSTIFSLQSTPKANIKEINVMNS